jgi:hypothetical protein
VKFARHETFHFREGWLSKGLRKVVSENKKDIFQRKDAMEELGIGSNMVKALRYWMQATQLTAESGSGKKQQDLTPFGQLVFDHDRYLEEEFTLWLIHYHLVTNFEQATAWYWFFNAFRYKEFDEAVFISELQDYVKEQSEDIAPSSLKKDLDCILNTYLISNYQDSLNPENNLGCPLQELGIIEVVDPKNKRYRITRRNINEIPLEVFWFGIIDFVYRADRSNEGTNAEVTIDELLNMPNSIGRIFNLGLGELIQVLDSLEAYGNLYISRTAGLNRVSIPLTEQPLDIITRFYQSGIGV